MRHGSGRPPHSTRDTGCANCPEFCGGLLHARSTECLPPLNSKLLAHDPLSASCTWAEHIRNTKPCILASDCPLPCFACSTKQAAVYDTAAKVAATCHASSAGDCRCPKHCHSSVDISTTRNETNLLAACRAGFWSTTISGRAARRAEWRRRGAVELTEPQDTPSALAGNAVE